MAKYVFFLDGTGAHHTRLVSFINNHLNPEDFLFLYCGISCDAKKVEGGGNAYLLTDYAEDKKHLKETLRLCEKIVIVGLFDVKLCFYLLRHQSLLRKTTVALHGGEFYGQRGKTSLKRKMFYSLRRIIIPKCAACATFTPDDYIFGKQFYRLPKTHYLAELPWYFDVTPDEAAVEKQSSPLLVMVGHKASPEDHTVEALRALAKFKDESIEIIAPVSYGNSSYREEVLDEGARIFGEKFHPLLDWIEPDEYRRMLQRVSVFVIGVDRQAATFNINLMLRLGCKVFARTDTTLWTFYSDYCNCQMFPIDSIEQLTFEELRELQQEDRLKNSYNMQHALNEDTCIAAWERILGIF